MTRRRVAHWFTLLFAILAITVCFASFAHRARAGSSHAQAKKAKATSLALPTAESSPKLGSSNASADPVAAPTAVAVVVTPPIEQAGKTGGPDLTSIPTGGGLPVMVGIAVSVIEVQSFDDVKGEFEAATDLRLRWSDPRLRYHATGVTGKYVEYRGKAAEERLEKLWVPNVDIANRLETSGYVGHRLRVFADGQVETIVRATGRYKVDLDVKNFPFDTQALKQTLVVRDQTTDEVVLHFDKDDEEFSRAMNTVQLDSWKIDDVDLEADLAGGWNGDRYSRVTASLVVKRFPSTGLTTIFIPLLASLLIPLLAIWMNRATPEGFEVEAFELANMGIGGLFSVIALSYAVSSAYGSIAGSDNTVTRLFALNYATLAVALVIVVVFFQRNVMLRHFGPYVHEQVFKFVLWALPVLTLGTSIAFVLIAAC
jgi:hypothetical protein